MRYDIAIIGAGVIGTMIARTLSKYQMQICVLEKNIEPASQTSGANSGIVHAGYDAKTNSLKAKLNVRGNAMMEDVCKQLDVPFKRVGSFVIGMDDEDRKTIEELYETGIKNGVPNLSIIDGGAVRCMEANIQNDVTCALFAQSAGIVCPYELTTAALEVACENGVDFKRNFEVASINKCSDEFIIKNSQDEAVSTKIIINAAGLYSDVIAKMVGDESFDITPRKGEYVLFEKTMGNHVSKVIFQTPKDGSKGILVSPTVDGNLYIGPNATFLDDKEDTSTTFEGIEEVVQGAIKSVKNIRMNAAITNFAGLRATSTTGDFVINQPVNNFFNVAGIESPGLSAAPAIAEYVENLIIDSGISLELKEDYTLTREHIVHFRELDTEQKAKLVETETGYGNIVCRCETITEQEIRNAIRRKAGARTVDGVKRRTRAGMGRCQGGFCAPRVMEILAEELNCSIEEITKRGGNSKILVGKTR